MFLSSGGGSNAASSNNSGSAAVNNSKTFLQAHLGNNLAAATLVAGNANVVNDTLGTGNWKFYVAGNTSIASITGSSASSEWTGGSLLSYFDVEYYMFYPFNTNTVSGNTLLNKATNSYDATLYGGASIINTVPSPAAQPPATGSGYLEMNVGAGQYAQLNQSVSLNQSGSTISVWFRWTNNITNAPIFQYGNGNDFIMIYMSGRDWCVIAWKIGANQGQQYAFNSGTISASVGTWVHVAVQSSTGNVYANGILYVSASGFSSISQPTYFYFGNYNPVTSNIANVTADFSVKAGTISMDNFVIYNKTLTAQEIGALYAKSDIYYTFDSDSVSGTSIGNKASGTYVNDATLVNSASIGTTNPSSAPTSGTGHLQVTSANNIATNQYVQLTFQPSFLYLKNTFSVSFWARSNSSLGSSAKNNFFDFANSIAASENANYSFSMYLQSNNIRGKISHGASGIAANDYVMYTDSNILTDNVWRHYVWTVQGDQGQTVEWKFYVNSVLVYTKTGGFVGGGGTPTDYVGGIGGIYYTNSFIGRDAGSWQTASFTGAIDEFRWYKSRVIGQSEVSNLYATQVSVGKFQNPSGGNPTWIATPATVVDSSETNYTVKSNEIALTPGTNSTYAVWTATKSTNLKIDVSFADYHTRSSGVGFQMFKIKANNTFDSVLFPRTVTSTALTNAAPSNYLSVPTINTTVTIGDKIYYRVDANGNATAASSVLATTIFTDAVSVANNPVENRLLQAQLGNNLNSTTIVFGNSNSILDTLGTSDWKFYVAGNTSVASITSSSASSEWSSGSILGAQYAFDGILMNGATIVVDAGSRVPGNPYLKLSNPTYNTSPYQYAKFTPVSIPSGGISFSMWVKHTSLPANTYSIYFSIRGNGQHIDMGLFNPTPEWYVFAGQVIKVDGTVSTITNGNWHHLVWTISASGMFNMYLDNSLRKTQQSTYPGTGLRTFYNIGSYNDTGDTNYLINGGVDNFKIFTRELTASEVTAEYNNNTSTMPFMLMTDSGSAPKWTIKPATLVDASETNYTVKSNEIALTPGTNSTYAVWTAPKSTNLKIDVSFADYNSRSAGVGFQMFKINSDNTFGSVIFPRTVTSTALTNSTGSYLSVPSRTISVATGDKIYYRVDANGNTTAASSVLATAIYTDPNQDLKQYKYLQAHLGNNMSAVSFVAGNANVVNDTLGTGNWNFYVAGNTSIASITGSSASSEWTVGNLLSYAVPSTPPSNYSIFYPFDSDSFSGTNVGNKATGSYVNDAILTNGATISTSQYKYGTASLYLNNPTATGSAAQNLKLPTFTISQSTGFSVSFWTYSVMPTLETTFLFDFSSAVGGGNNMMLNSTNANSYAFYSNYTSSSAAVNTSTGVLKLNQWSHVCITISTTNFTTIYVDSVSVYSGTPVGNAFAGTAKTGAMLGATYFGSKGLNGYVDDFKIYNTELTSGNVSALYSGPSPASIKDITSGVTWLTVPATAVDANETSYTVKSNEIALAPGTNSTFAVWTATKSTNLKIDVSFADYHTRSSGVGFQMFKINSDNTFGSVLFPRTVTTAALTNAAPSNYLSVPSITTTVNVGDKLYYRIDGNGNTMAASSVLATSIYTDDVSVASNPVENRLLQAQLATNMNSTTFVGGNANAVYDTVGTGDWKFYVAGNASTAAITGSSASTEWTGGTLLSANDTFPGTLLFGATYVSDAGSRVSGKNYLKLNNSIPGPSKCASILPFTPTTNGISFSFWIRHTIIQSDYGAFFFNFRDSNNVNQTFIGGSYWFSSPGWLAVSNNSGNPVSTGIPFSSVGDGNWHHIAWTMTYSASTTSTWKFYLDGVASANTTLTDRSYMNLVTRIYHNIGTYNDSGDVGYAINGGVDNFKIYHKVLSDAEVLADVADIGNIPTQLSDSISQSPIWKLKPAIAVISTETSYTVKSNEIALAPGANSTYAVWTSPKTTNIKVDVSFADYHSRSAGVGFQMFKINNDNTFGGVIFPRTVTSTALTNANPTNYLSVPSRTISVATGDKIYYRVDANGNPTSASSVLATNIYVDPNQDLKQYKYLQANLGNNIASTSFVAGNANVVNDTRGTGNWNFYVAGNTSIASITGSSASSEWTSGSLLSYITPTVPPTNYSIFYPFNTADINPGNASQVGDLATGSYVYNGTLVGSATINNTVDGNSRVPGQGYLSLIKTGTYFRFAPFNVTTSGFSFVFWGRFASTTNTSGGRILDIRNPEISLQRAGAGFTMYVTAGGGGLVSGDAFDNVWRHYAVTVEYAGPSGASSLYKLYTNGTLTSNGAGQYPALGTRSFHNLGTYLDSGDSSGVDGGIDDFRIYPRPISAIEVNAIYAGASPASIKDITSGVSWMSVPGTLVDASETSYTVKSNEVALTPGTNSTYAVWTATKFTNIKVDVSFADYHTRSSGVGFQMFKVKSDNTFDSVLFPRTVTSTALTNAAPNNYLSVPTITTTVNVGDKLYYRVDANGNTMAASSVFATSIYTDDVSVASNPVENRLLQANLGNNLASATFVGGNANAVYDTVGTGDWNFYVAGNTSVAAISSASASSEWTSGSLLSYFPNVTPVLTNYSLFYSFSSDKVSGTTVYDVVTNYAGTLVNGATIAVDANSRVSGEGYLKLNKASFQHMSFPSFTPAASGISFSVWFYTNSNLTWARIFDFCNSNADNILAAIHTGQLVLSIHGSPEKTVYNIVPLTDNLWYHLVWTIASDGTWIVYINGTTVYNLGVQRYPTTNTRIFNYFGNSIFSEYWNGGIDNFRYYDYVLSPSNVTTIYNSGDNDPSIEGLKNTATGVMWKSVPATVVNASETNYTVKSNEIALTPGTNSTYAVWTAPKPTNIRIDVSFADYHSRSAGVGFQMFKINSDNTFGSVIFPRTVTSTALTNANSSNYLSVPSRSLSVSTGDKIYYRIDANGNTNAASSVLATNIYTYSGKWS